MTNDLIRRRFDTFARIEGFGTRYASGFSVGSRGAGLFAGNATIVDGMQKAGADQLSGGGTFHGGTSAKEFWAGELREDLEEIRGSAVAISVAEDTPDFEDQFRMPRGNNYGQLLTTARAFLQDATPHKALFIEFELAADFLEDLAEDIEEFEKASGGQNDGLGDQVGGTANLAALSSKGLKVRKQLRAIVKNKFKGNTAVLAAWETASHFERAPKSAKKPGPAQAI